MRRQRFDTINVVPFIDIVLVLLVIVLATATFMKQKSMSVDLPKASSAQPITTKQKELTIGIDQHGALYLDAQPTTLKKIKLELNKLDKTKDRITLSVDKRAKFDRFIKLIDLLKQHKFGNILITTL